MAKNYSIAEAVQVLVENEDTESILDLGKRYPLLVNKVARLAVLAGEELVDFMSFFPEHMTANKINSYIKKALEAEGEESEEEEAEEEDDVEEEEADEKPVKKAKSTKKEKKASAKADGDDYDYDNMNNAKMYKLLGELGKRKECKEKFGDLSHDSMLKFLKKYGPKTAGETAEEEDVAEEAEGADEYEGMTAVELFKLCKKRKIKAEQKKTAKYYAGLLRKADAEAAEAEAEDDEEWDDEEEEAPKKPAKKEKKAAKKSKKEEPVEEDDDDDDDAWDI